MDHSRSVAKFILVASLIGLTYSVSISTEPNLLNIVEDVIPDVDNSTQKVIRVNTVDLPPLLPDSYNTSDSFLYKIQPLMAPPTYVSSRKFRKEKNISSLEGVREYNQLKIRKNKKPRQKHLHMLYNQQGFDGKNIAKRMKVRVAPGAYPIYYVVAKTNGEFHKQPIKGFRNQKELDKYFDKVEKISKLDTIGS